MQRIATYDWGTMNKRIVSAGLVAAAALALTACGGNGQPLPVSSAATSASQQAAASPSVTATAAVATAVPTATLPTVEAMPASLEKYEVMSLETFNNIPKKEQLAYWSWLTRDRKQYADAWYQISLDPRDKLPANISRDSTPQEILTNDAYNRRLVLSLTGEDKEKGLLAILEDGKNSLSYPSLKAYYDSYSVEITRGSVGLKALVMSGALTASTAQSTEGIEELSATTTIQNIRDASGVGEYYYETYTDAVTGKEASTWLHR